MQCECGFTLTGGGKFCPECGKKVSVQGTANKQTVLCPNTIQDKRRTTIICGTPVENSQKFCVECCWKVDPRAFLSGAVMCQGNIQNGAPCDNIVTPNVKFCSECGRPPGFGASASAIPPVVKKEVMAAEVESLSQGHERQLTQGHEGQHSSNDQTEPTAQDMDLEFVNFTQSNEGLRRTDSYEKATNLENSSDFCNGFPKFTGDSKSSSQSSVTQEAGSSSQDKILKSEGGGGESPGMLDSMEIVERPSGGWEMSPPAENFQEGQGEGVGGGKEDSGNGKVEKPNEKGDGKRGQAEGNSEGKTDKRQEGQINETQQENEQEVKDSGSISRENSVYEPSWKKKEGNKETDDQSVIERFQLLDMRKRKSPERELPDGSKKLHLSVEDAREDKNGNKTDGSQLPEEEEKVEEEGDENGEEDEEEEEDDEESEGERNAENTEKSGGKKKRHQGKKKKKKLEYQRKKGQLPAKPTDSKANETDTTSSQVVEKGKLDKPKVSASVQKAQDKKEKTEENRKFKSQTSREKPREESGGQPLPSRGHLPQAGQPPPPGGQSPQTGGHLPPSGQPPPQGGQLNPLGGQPTPPGGQPTPSRGQPTPSGGQPTPSRGLPTPSGGQPPQQPGGQPTPSGGQSAPGGYRSQQKTAITLQPGEVEIPVTYTEKKDNKNVQNQQGRGDNFTSNEEKEKLSYAAAAATNRPVTRSLTQSVEVNFSVLVSKELVKDVDADIVFLSFHDIFSGAWDF